MKLYLSGKMTGLPNFGFDIFNAAAAKLRALGYEVVNPAELDAADIKQLEWHEYLRRDIAHLVTCDGIALLTNWRDSKGARLEHHIAVELGMTVIALDDSGAPARHPMADEEMA